MKVYGSSFPCTMKKAFCIYNENLVLVDDYYIMHSVTIHGTKDPHAAFTSKRPAYVYVKLRPFSVKRVKLSL
jgi:hypothetical protein